MLVYGDAVERERAADKLARVAATSARADALAPGLSRHAARVAALIEAGELAQGLADRAFELAGRDRADGAADAAMALAFAIAKRCAASWRSEFAGDEAAREEVDDALARCRASLPEGDGVVEIRQPEGYAFYALYPESYLEAALALPRRRWQAIGVRSIGTSLACMVAAGLDASPPISVRPRGAPFSREVVADRALIDRSADAYALVDEGPGQSGSSLAAVAQWLRDAGVAEERVHVLASHDNGPGAHASVQTRAWWTQARDQGRVHVRTFDAVVLGSGRDAHRLDRWVAGVVGPLAAPLAEIGGGAWRAMQWRRAGDDLPPAHPWQERRKFVAVGVDASEWLVKFNGIGTRAERKLARARGLGAAGLTPMPIDACHGFLVERWLGPSVAGAAMLRTRAVTPARSVPRDLEPDARLALLDRIAGYLAFRARRFAAPSTSGATVEALFAMARHNSDEALGAPAAAAWRRWEPALPMLAAHVRRIETDNRMHRWEWLIVAGGVIVKTDAVDHHAGHDLVGCQDVAWDIAGAAIEFDLGVGEEERLLDAVAASAHIEISRPLVAFCRGCYAAFQLAYYEDAAQSSRASDEARRLRAARDRYAERLRTLLADPAFTPTR